jgi:C4-dicarboxylate-specific signal transduction histidine kinase
VTGTDELASLAEAFNQMNLGLRVSHEQLALTNRRLEERQKELEQSHARVLRSKQALEEINRELRDTQAQLVQAGKMAAFGELGAGIAHDLNQPLATVKGFAQLTLSRLEPSSPHRRALDLIVSAVDHMARIVAGLRNFARKSTFESAPVDVNGVIEETRLFLEHQLRRRGVLLTTELEPSLPAVAGDATQFQQVLTNLITNARDALEGRSAPAIRIATRTARGGRLIVLRVSDNGPGIPPEIRRNIFRSFFTTKEPGKGTGLGLSISRGIVQNHGGRIHAVCPSRGGTTFTIVLPALTPDKASGGHRNQDNRAA